MDLRRQVIDLEKLSKKKSIKEKELEKANEEIQSLEAKRVERYASLAYMDASTEHDDRELKMIKRSLPALREKSSDLADSIKGYDTAIKNKNEALRQQLEIELLKKACDSEATYTVINKKHLEMLQSCNLYASEHVKPARLAKDHSRRDTQSFQSRWDGQKLLQALHSPILFVELSSLATLLGLESELAKAKEKRELESKRRSRDDTKEDTEKRLENERVETLAQRILAGKIPLPQHLKPYVDNIASVGKELLVKLLRQHPQEVEEPKRKDGTVFDKASSTIIDEKGIEDEFPEVKAGEL